MAYYIHKYIPVPGTNGIGERLDGGQTRAQVMRALERLNLIRTNERQEWKLPQLGKMTVICHPKSAMIQDYCIINN